MLRKTSKVKINFQPNSKPPSNKMLDGGKREMKN